MANETINFNLPSPYQAEMAKIAQQKKMAEMLQAQSLQPTERYSYKGIEAHTPATAGLAKILQAMSGAYLQKKGLEEQNALGERYRADQMSDMTSLANSLDAPAVAGSAAVAEMPERPGMVTAPGFAPTQAMDEEGQPVVMPATAAKPAIQSRPAGYVDPQMMSQMKTQEGSNKMLALILAQRQSQLEAEKRANEPYTLAEGAGRYQPMPDGLPPKLIAGGPVPKTPPSPFAPIDVSKFTQESVKAATNPDGTVDRSKLVPLPVEKPGRTGELGIYDEYVKQQIALGKTPMGINEFMTAQKIAGRTPGAVTYGSPVAATDAQGRPVFIQPGKGGGAPSVIEGFSPVGEKLKPVPQHINSAIIGNQAFLNKLDRANSLLTKNPEATGFFKGITSNEILNRMDPSGTETRAALAELAASKVHDLSGAAVSVGEFARLKPFLPVPTDNAETLKTKLKNMRAEIQDIMQMTRSVYSENQGYKSIPEFNQAPAGKTPRYNPATGKIE